VLAGLLLVRRRRLRLLQVLDAAVPGLAWGSRSAALGTWRSPPTSAS
jgi:hypothetical protein